MARKRIPINRRSRTSKLDRAMFAVETTVHRALQRQRRWVLEHKVAGEWSPMRRVTELEGEQRIRRAQARGVEARVRPLRDDDRLDQLL